MGLFTKFSGGKSAKEAPVDAAPVKKEKRSKEKKSLFGGKKKEATLLERMQLEESVAAASLEVVQELAEIGGSAVRELDEGLLIVAITNDMLQEAGLDPAGEEFGSFAQALRSETIESIALSDDLAVGVIGIIPSQETLISLDEFDFVHDMAFRWALVPFDLSDDDRLTVLDSTVHIDRLMEMSNDSGIQLAIKNGEVVEKDGGPAAISYVQDSDEEDDELDDPGFEEEEEEEDDELLDDGYDPQDGVEDDPFEDEGFDDDASFSDDDSFDDATDSGYEDDFELEDDSDMDELDDIQDSGSYAEEEEELLSAEETKEAINRLAAHGFNNTELNLNIDMTKFDDYFDSVSIAQFDAARTDDSELQNVLSKLRQDANVELSRFHQDNVQSLRNKFTTSMRDIHNKLVESLDHKDEKTTYGRRHYEIEADYDDVMADLDRRVAGEVAEINKSYNESREEYAENAKREALAVYDSRYRDERNRKIDSAKDHIQSDAKTDRDNKLGELYSDRRTVAQRLFDKAMTALLQKLQEEYQHISQKELQMYDAFRKSMDVYLRKHFADEVLRAKAEAEKLKQSHEAERVRTEYEQMLITKTRQLDEADRQARENLRQLEGTHKEQIDHVKADYERRIEREQRENQNLREMLQDANASNSKIGEQKDKEVEHLMNVYKNESEALKVQLKYANERANTAQKPMKFIIGSVAAVMLAMGVIFGFMFGANSIQIAPAATEPQGQENQSVSYQNEAPSADETDTEYEEAS
ncbi:hypothetical protein [Metabacillus sp. SLBN-84]